MEHQTSSSLTTGVVDDVASTPQVSVLFGAANYNVQVLDPGFSALFPVEHDGYLTLSLNY